MTVCYVDYAKAFDSIPLCLLIKKLEAYGISGCLLNFLRSFLLGRSQRVIVNGSLSATYPTTSGVPQGTCLGPLMFLLYINDMPSCLPLEVNCSIYADDSKIYSINNCDALQKALDALLKWSEKWKLDISFEKTSIMCIGRRHPPNCSFYLGHYRLIIEKSVRDLGVTYNDRLSYEKYIEKSICKVKLYPASF